MKLDLHVHTAEVSPCGTMSAEATVQCYKKAGFSGIVITDHYNSAFCTREKDSENAEAFLEGYRKAKAAGDACGLAVYLGMELKLNAHPHNEYLLLGIDAAFIRQNPRLFELPLEEVHKIVSDYGGLVIQAHPYRNEVCTPAPAKWVDGYEVFNGHFNHRNHNDQAALLGTQTGLLQTAGSDCHCSYDVGNGGIETDRLPTDSRSLAACIRAPHTLYRTVPQHLKAVLLSADCSEALADLKEINADVLLCLKPLNASYTAPVLEYDVPTAFYHAAGRYTAFAGDFSVDPLETSVCIASENHIPQATCAVYLGTKSELQRINGQFRISVPNNSLAVIECNGYAPKILFCKTYS